VRADTGSKLEQVDTGAGRCWSRQMLEQAAMNNDKQQAVASNDTQGKQ